MVENHSIRAPCCQEAAKSHRHDTAPNCLHTTAHHWLSALPGGMEPWLVDSVKGVQQLGSGGVWLHRATVVQLRGSEFPVAHQSTGGLDAIPPQAGSNTRTVCLTPLT